MPFICYRARECEQTYRQRVADLLELHGDVLDS